MLRAKLTPKEERVYSEVGRKLLRHPPHYNRRIVDMTDPKALPSAQLVQKQIPIDKLLMQYGKSQIQLIASEEELGNARNIIQSLQQTVMGVREELAKLTEERDMLKAKVAAYEQTDHTDAAELEETLPPEPAEPAQN